MESPELILVNKQERVTIFKIPPLSTSKGHYLDDWKDMVWQGGVKVVQKNRNIKVTFLTKEGKVFGQTKIPNNYKEAIVKTNDSSRGYAVRLDNPKGGYIWIGVAFRDRNDAFDFGVAFQQYADKNKIHDNPNILTQEFGEKLNFSLGQGEKVKININKKSEKKESEGAFDFGSFDFKQDSKAQAQPKKSNNDWDNFDFGPSTKTQQNKKIEKKDNNLIDFD